MSYLKVFLNHGKQYLFWIAYFFTLKVAFLTSNWSETSTHSFTEVLKAFYHGYKLDQSIVCYALIIPIVLSLLSSLIKTNLFNRINRVYTVLMILIITILCTAELNLYPEWKQKLSFKAISYMTRPSEVFHTASWEMLIFGFGFSFLLTAGFLIIYNKFIYDKDAVKWRNPIVSILLFVVILGLQIVGLRGGFQPIPISQSEAFYSESSFLNNAAMNSIWNLAHSIEKNAKYGVKNPFEFHNKSLTKKTVENLYTIKKDTTIKIFTHEQPNVVIVMLESWAGGMIKSLGGLDGVTPKFEELAAEGLLFDNFYATATLSHQGMVAIYGGFPTTPHVDIINQVEKVQQLPKLTQSFEKVGYNTSFLFGGQLIYGNIKGYILNAGFDKIEEGDDFDETYEQGRLGVHDEGLFRKLLENQNQYKEPFFSGAFTCSTHSPFDYPKGLPWLADIGQHEKFVNSVHYADSVVFDYIQNAKKQPWFKNTVFVFVADHSHPTPISYPSTYSPGYRKVPMLIYGEPLKKELRGTKNHRLMSQADIAATLLAQFDLPYRQFEWSTNVYNPYAEEFVYYGFDDGLGWLRPDSNYFVYQSWDKELSNKGYIQENYTNDSVKTIIRTEGESYLQALYQRYLDY